MAKGSKRRMPTVKTVNHVLGRANPYPSLPPGGKPGDVLVKTHYPDGEVDWEPVEQNPYKHRSIPLGYLLSAATSNSATSGRNKNEVGWFAAGSYPFTHNNFGDHSYSDNKWRTWLDLDTDIGKYVKELGQELVGATIVAYVQHSSTWFYGGPQRGRIDAVHMTTISNGLLQVTFDVHDETNSKKWTKPEAHTTWSLPFSDIDNSQSRYSPSYWTDYEKGDPKENLLWFIERQSDLLTRADSAGIYKVFRDGNNQMATPGTLATFRWENTSYNNHLMRWRCKVGGSNGTYGTFVLKINEYATGTTLFCPADSKFDFVWPGSNIKTEFHAGSIKINGSSVHRVADLLTVAKASRDAEDFRQKLIAHLEEIVGRDAAEAKAMAAVEENPPEPEIEPGPEEEPEEAPKRTKRKKSGD